MALFEWLDPTNTLQIHKCEKSSTKKCDYCGLPVYCHLCNLITFCEDDSLFEMILLYSKLDQLSIIRQTSEFIKQYHQVPTYKKIDPKVKNVNLSLLEYIHHLENNGPPIKNLSIFFTKNLKIDYLITDFIVRQFDDDKLLLDTFIKKDEQLGELEMVNIKTSYIISDTEYYISTLLSTYKNMVQ